MFAVADSTKSIESFSDLTWASLQYAWLLATCEDPEVRDSKVAIRLASEACRSLEWKNASAVRALAAAYACGYDFEQAVKYQKMCMELEKGINDETLLRLYEEQQRPCDNSHLFSSND